jgi:hypothetical protein
MMGSSEGLLKTVFCQGHKAGKIEHAKGVTKRRIN